MKPCCPCDALTHPARPDIPAGLPALPRQLATFPEYRLAMLRDLPLHPPLAGWRAREGDDLGLMLLEMWAYVLDILGFYDERIANETYLRTTTLRPSARKLAGLIGYQPRPALAASVVLAAIATGHRPVTIPPRTGFRSDAFDGEPPQVFETEGQTVIHPLKNQWTLGLVREKTVSERLLLEVETARLTRDQLVLFVWSITVPVTPAVQAATDEMLTVLGNQRTPPVTTVTKAVARQVLATKVVDARDAQTYVEVDVGARLPFDVDLPLSQVQVMSPSLTAAVTGFQPAAHVASRAGVPTLPSAILLDAIYRQIRQDDMVVISRGRDYRPFQVVDVAEVDVIVNVAARVSAPVTQLQVSPPLPEGWAVAIRSLTIHFNMIDSGKLTRVAKTGLNTSDFAPPGGVPIAGIGEPIPSPQPSELLLQDAHDNGRLVGGSVDIKASGAGKIILHANVPPFDNALRTPVTAFGNVVRATRGESVFNEVLGSGDTAQTFQSFTLSNKPLTYINDPTAPGGRRTTLEVRVNTIIWQEVPSFFGTGPEDEVYIVRQNDAEEAVVTFGDGTTGARLPTGIDNVTATYRFGAGAAKPPAGGISQLARPVEGLRRVLNPVAPGGGADADRPQDVRRNAPNSALILGRAVSVQDFEALAREFGGVLNAYVEWAWDETCQSAVVKVWFISDGGDIKKALEAFLIGQADPHTPLVAEAAQAEFSKLIIDLDIDPRFNSATVVEQVRQALSHPETGILALANIPIGRPLFRSRIFDTVLSVEGARSVRAMTVNGQPAPFSITARPGRYHNFLDGLVIGNTAVGDMLRTTEDSTNKPQDGTVNSG